MTEELAFNTSSHTLDNFQEFYADNYLSFNYDLPNNHRAKNIISLINKWNVLQNGFAFYRSNMDKGSIKRMGDTNPQTY